MGEGGMTSSGFVGRQRELAALNAHLAAARQGGARFVFISGEPGSGKSTLVQKFLEGAVGSGFPIRWLKGRCIQHFGEGQPFLPFIEAVQAVARKPREKRRFLGLWGQIGSAWLPVIPIVGSALKAAADTSMILSQPAGSLRGGDPKAHLFSEYAAMLRQIAGRNLLLLFLDDLHWADPSSVGLMLYLADRFRDQPFLLLGTFRPTEVETAASHPLREALPELARCHLAEELSLPPLSLKEVGEYLDIRYPGHRFLPSFASRLLATSSGNPLFIEEILQSLVEQGHLRQQEKTWEVAAEDLGVIPKMIDQLIWRRLDDLDRELRELLTYASLQGIEFDSVTLAGVTGQEELGVLDHLEEGVKKQRILRHVGERKLPDGELAMVFEFHHALIRRALADSVSGKRKLLLHRRLGEELERHYASRPMEVASQIAHHFLEGHEWERAFRYLLLAGDRARQTCSSHEAIGHYDRAFALIEQGNATVEPRSLVCAHLSRGAARELMSDYAGAIGDYRAAIEEARRIQDRGAEAEALIRLAGAEFLSQESDSPKAHAEEAIALARALGEQELLALALAHLGNVFRAQGDLVASNATMEEAIAIARPAGCKPAMLVGLGELVAQSYWRGEFRAACDRAPEVVELCRQTGDRFREGWTLLFVGRARAGLGEYDEAFAALDRSRKLAEEIDNRFLLAQYPNTVSMIYRDWGELDAARAADLEGLELAQAWKMPPPEISVRINLAADYALAGETSEARRHLEAARQLILHGKGFGWHRWRWETRLSHADGWVALRMGNLERATASMERGLELARTTQAHRYLALGAQLALEIEAARGNLQGAVAWTERGLEASRAIAYRPLEAWLLWRKSELLRQLGAAPAEVVGACDAARQILAETAARIAHADRRQQFLFSTLATRSVSPI